MNQIHADHTETSFSIQKRLTDSSCVASIAENLCSLQFESRLTTPL